MKLPKDLEADILARGVVGPTTNIYGTPLLSDQPPPVNPFLLGCQAHGLPTPAVEFRFDDARRWRFDYAWPDHLIAVEIEGGAFKGPGHRSVGVFLRNIEKYNAAAVAGWCLLRVTTDDVKDGSAFALVAKALKGRAP